MNVTSVAEYAFSDKEMKGLALIFRNHPEFFCRELDSFGSFLESYLYQNMTIEEAEKFFNE